MKTKKSNLSILEWKEVFLTRLPGNILSRVLTTGFQLD